jgi:hypothetical protein
MEIGRLFDELNAKAAELAALEAVVEAARITEQWMVLNGVKSISTLSQVELKKRLDILAALKGEK